MTFTTDAIINNTQQSNTITNRYFDELTPIDGEWQAIHQKQGDILNASLQPNDALNKPAYLIPYNTNNNQWLVLGSNQRPKIYNISENNLWTLNTDITAIPYHSPSPNNTGMAYSTGGDYNTSTKQLALVSWSRHVIRVYNENNNWELSFEIGTAGSAGNVVDDKLYNPRACIWLNNGNLLVSSFYGKGQTGAGNGHLTEYNGQTGEIIQTRLEFAGNGQSEINANKIYRPMDLQIDPDNPNIIWCMEYGRNQVLQIDATTWTVTKIYYPPLDESWNSAWSFGVNQDYIFVFSNTYKRLNIINKLTGELIRAINAKDLGHSGVASYGNIREIQNEFINLSDIANNNIQQLYIPDTIDITYTEPYIEPDWEVQTLIANNNNAIQDITNYTATVSTLALNNIANTNLIALITKI